MNDADSLKKSLEQLLPYIPEGSWNLIVDEGDVQRVLSGEMPFTQLLKKAEDNLYLVGWGSIGGLREEGYARPMLSLQDVAKSAKQYPLRQVVISHLIAIKAANETGVQHFRNTGLNDELLVWEQMEMWISKQYLIEKETRVPTKWLSVIPLPAEEAARILHASLNKSLETEPPITVTIPAKQVGIPFTNSEALEFYSPGDKRVRTLPTPSGGYMEQLEQLSKRLAEQYPWTRAQATIFVLTGLSPLVRPITHSFQDNVELPANSHITLTIDPFVAPEEVAEHYRKYRRSIVESRQREMSDKHLMLALFAATRTEDETWVRGMEEWNQEHPEWAYKEHRNFSRDAIQASRRLLFPSFQINWWTLEERFDKEGKRRG